MRIKVDKKSALIFFGGSLVGSVVSGVFFRAFYKKKYENSLTEMVDRVNEAEKLIKQAMNESKNDIQGGNSGETIVKIENSGNEDDDFGELSLEEYQKLRQGVVISGDSGAGKGSDSSLNGGSGNGKGSKRSSFRAYTDYYRGIRSDIFEDSSDDLGNSGVDPAELEHPEDDEDFSVVNDENVDAYSSMKMTEEIKKSMKNGPKVISMSEFDEERADLEKVTLYFYTVDEVLTDENDEEIIDVERTVGDALDKYDFRYNDDEYVCVRNIAFGADYMIKKIYGAYMDGSR